MNAAALKKKIGPLPMWAWIVIVGGTIGIYLYRKNKSSAINPNAIDPATGLPYSQEAAMQAAGIDPLTGQTYASETPGSSGASGGGSSNGTTPTDPFSLIDPLTGVTYGSELGRQPTDPFQQIDPATGQTYASEITGAIGLLEQAATTHSQNAPKRPALRGKGAIRAPSGHSKPPAKKGYTIRGLGGGNWEYVPVHNRHGSGAAGHAGSDKPHRRTVKITGPTGKRPSGGRHTVPVRTRHSGKKKVHRPGTRLSG